MGVRLASGPRIPTRWETAITLAVLVLFVVCIAITAATA